MFLYICFFSVIMHKKTLHIRNASYIDIIKKLQKK